MAGIAEPMVEIVLRIGRQIRCRVGIGDNDLEVFVNPIVSGAARAKENAVVS